MKSRVSVSDSVTEFVDVVGVASDMTDTAGLAAIDAVLSLLLKERGAMGTGAEGRRDPSGPSQPTT